MNLNAYEIEGPPPLQVGNSLGLERDNQPDNYNVGDQNPVFQPCPGDRLRQGPGPNTPQYLNVVTSNASSLSCRFRSDVLDDCSGARFYARMLEFYLLDKEDADLSCPFVDCDGRNYRTAEEMLRHVKHCPHQSKGMFRCPLCGRDESYKTRPSSRCRWDKEHFLPKIFRNAKNIIRNFAGNQPETQSPVSAGLCYQCSAPIHKASMQNVGHATQLIEGCSNHSTLPVFTSNQMQWDITGGWPELESSTSPSELAGEDGHQASSVVNLSTENSPKLLPSHPLYDNTYLVSGVSSAVVSPDENMVNTNVSPGSSCREGISVPARRRNAGTIIRRVTRRRTGGYSEPSPISSIVDQRSTSLYGNVPLHHGLGSFNTINEERFLGHANLPNMFTPYPAPRDGPKLRIETSPESLGLIVPASEFQIPSNISQMFDYSAMETHTATDLPTSMMHSQSSAVSTIDAPPLRDDLLTAQSNSSSDPSPSTSLLPTPNAQQNAPDSSPSEKYLKCTYCDFEPQGQERARKAYLRKHVKHNHGDRPLIPCDYCNQTFTRSDNMKSHCRREHSTSSTSSSKRRRCSSDSVHSPLPMKRRNAVKGRKVYE